MRRRRDHPERDLRPGRAALCAESCLRLLFPETRECPPVREHRSAGAAACAADRGSEDGLRDKRVKEGTSVADGDDGLLSSLRYLFADFLDEPDHTPPFLPDGLPEGAAAIVSDG